MKLYLVRGLPGSGKSTRASHLDVTEVCEADQYFEIGGDYQFDPKKLSQAHAWCREKTRRVLQRGESVAVANTFTQWWEMEPYFQMAEETGAEVEVVSVYDGGCSDEELAARNLHGVPLETIRRMRERWEDHS